MALLSPAALSALTAQFPVAAFASAAALIFAAAPIPAAVLVPAVAFAGLSGALALPIVFEFALRVLHRTRIQGRVVEGSSAQASLFAALCRRGIPLARPLASLLLRVRVVRAECECYARVLRMRGFEVVSPRVACELLLALIVVVALLALLITGMPFMVVCAVILTIVLISGRAHKILSQWGEKLVEQIPEALRSLGLCFNAGYSLQQAFEQTAQDTPDPLGAEMRQASFDIAAGRSIGEALSALERRTDASDLRFAIVALEIQHRTGGSLRDLLENAADAVLASAELRRQLGVQTAQARLSAKVVTILPLVLVALLSLAMEGYLQSFFSSPEGLGILFAALGMEALGVLMIRRILGVDLG